MGAPLSFESRIAERLLFFTAIRRAAATVAATSACADLVYISSIALFCSAPIASSVALEDLRSTGRACAYAGYKAVNGRSCDRPAWWLALDMQHLLSAVNHDRCRAAPGLQTGKRRSGK